MHKWWGPVRSHYAKYQSQDATLHGDHPKCPYSGDLMRIQTKRGNGDTSPRGCCDENPALVEAKFWGLEELLLGMQKKMGYQK